MEQMNHKIEQNMTIVTRLMSRYYLNKSIALIEYTASCSPFNYNKLCVEQYVSCSRFASFINSKWTYAIYTLD